MDQSEKILLIAAAGYSRSNNVSLSKISWALSAVMQKPENSIYHKLKEIDGSLDEQLKDLYGVRNLLAGIDDEVEKVEDDCLEDRIGEIVSIEVLSIKTFGAVCRVQGTSRTLLLHLSEVTNEFINDLGKHLKEGDQLEAMLILNPKGELGLSTRRIKLSSKESA